MYQMQVYQIHILDISTHHNISIIITSQDSFSIPASIRRMCSHVMLWKNHDITSMNVLASRVGLKSADLKYIFNHICKEPRDSLLIDTTRKQRLRKIYMKSFLLIEINVNIVVIIILTF